MSLSSKLLTFIGLAHERPIQFINDLEIRASPRVEDNDSIPPQTIQQASSDRVLIWFDQLPKSSNIESNIEQQKVDAKLKSVVNQETKNL